MRRVLVCLISIISIVTLPVTSYGVHDDIGAFRCVECHERIPFKGIPLTYSRDIPSSCIRCHGAYHRGSGFRHPVGAVPRRPVPKDFVLGPQGEITCVTCHVFHPKASPFQGGRPTFLRRSSPKRLCIACHGSEVAKPRKIPPS